MKKMFLTCSLLSILILSCFSQGEEEDRGYIVKVGDQAPDFEMVLTSGEKIRLSDMQGRVVMLQFTASWCGVCRREMPFIESEIWQELKDRPDFALFGVDRDEPRDKVMAYADKVGISYPMGLDPGADIFALYALREAGVTRNVIIDREGKIIFLTRLFDREEFDAMKKILFEALNK